MGVMSSCRGGHTERLDHQFEILRPARGVEGLLEIYAVLFDQLQQGLVESLDALVPALRDGLLDLSRLGRVKNEVLYAPGRYHDLAGRRATAVLRPDKTLADDPLERAGEHGSHLPAFVWREEVYHAVHRLCGVDRVERREDEVPGLRCRQRDLCALGVPDLAD